MFTLPGTPLLNQDDSQQTWLSKVDSIISKEVVIYKNISWSAHFASLQDSALRPQAISALLPLFRDNAHSLTMIRHGMKFVKAATEHVNQGQMPVIVVDQPLYAIAKRLQWNESDEFGEDKFVVLNTGGLHNEMAFLSAIGDWLQGSGWVVLIVNANITTEDRVFVKRISYIKVSVGPSGNVMWPAPENIPCIQREP